MIFQSTRAIVFERLFITFLNLD